MMSETLKYVNYLNKIPTCFEIYMETSLYKINYNWQINVSNVI